MSDGRRRYLVAYDIRDPVRLRIIHDVVIGYGDPLQYSVFLCDLNESELIHLRADLGDEIDHRSDSIVIIDLGAPGAPGAAAFRFLGVRPVLPSGGGPQIV